MMATLSPGARPRLTRPSANAFTRSYTSAQVYSFQTPNSLSRKATRRGQRCAFRRRIPGSVSTGTPSGSPSMPRRPAGAEIRPNDLGVLADLDGQPLGDDLAEVHD